MPTEASHFVPLIFRALKGFFAIGTADGLGAALKDDFFDAFAEEVYEVVTQRYVVSSLPLVVYILLSS